MRSGKDVGPGGYCLKSIEYGALTGAAPTGPIKMPIVKSTMARNESRGMGSSLECTDILEKPAAGVNSQSHQFYAAAFELAEAKNRGKVGFDPGRRSDP